MEFLPFAFCESVCQILKTRELSCVQRIRSDFWGKAAAEASDRRVRLGITISYNQQTWSYNLLHRQKTMTFDELQEVDLKHLQVTKVHIGSCPQQASSLEEILEIVQFTIPFLCEPSMDILHNNLSEEALTAILSLYRNAPIYSLCCFESKKPVEEYLKNQLNSASPPTRLKIVLGGWSEEVRVAVEEFAISKPFVSIRACSDAFVFSKEFFERLFEKIPSSTTLVYEFAGKFSFEFKELRGFKPEIQLADQTTKFHCLKWRRVDGVAATVAYGEREKWYTVQFVSCK